MKYKKIWRPLSGIGILLAGMILIWYMVSDSRGKSTESIMQAVPDNTALIIRISRVGNLWEEIDRTNLMWKTLTRIPAIRDVRNQLSLLDSISRKNSSIRSVLQKNSLVIALTLSGMTRFGTIFITPLPGLEPAGEADKFAYDFFGDSIKISKTPYASTSIRRLQVGQKSPPFYYTAVKGFFIGSFMADLVKKSIDRATFNTPAFMTSGFTRVEMPSEKKTDAEIYINYRMLAVALSKISRTENHYALIQMARMASWTGLSVIVKKDGLSLNGFTLADDTLFHYLNLFSGQKAQSNDIVAVAPDITSWFVFLGWEDPAGWFERIELRNLQNENEGNETGGLSSFNRKYHLNLSDFFHPWMGRQAIVLGLEDSKDPQKNRYYAAIQARDTVLAISLLDSLSFRYGQKRDSMRYKGYKITGLHLNEVLPDLFGMMFRPAGQAYITLLKNFVVFGKDPASLKFLIDEYISGYTLNKDQDYIDFSGKLPRKSNISVYFNSSRSSRVLKQMIGDPLFMHLQPYLDSLVKFHPLGITWSWEESLLKTGVVIGFKPAIQKDSPLRWQARLDTTAAGSPQILNAMRSSEPVILVRDTLNTLYGYSPEGIQKWKMHFMGKILSGFRPVVFPGNDTVFYLFNTDTHLYMIRSDGQAAAEYPKRFPIPSTNPLTVVNMDRRGNYRIFIALKDKRVYQFDLEGKSMTSWERPLMKAGILHAVEYIVSNQKDFFFIRDSEGHMVITDRQGKSRVPLNPQFRIPEQSPVCPVKMARKGLFLTSGKEGKLIFIQENGRITETSLDRFTGQPWFFNENIMGHVIPDYIFVDRNRISYYNRSYKLVYSYSFRREISRRPFVVYDHENNQAMIGITIPETGELFLFDAKGNNPLDPRISGTTPFDLGRFGDEGTLNLVVGAGKYLRNYSLPVR